MITCILLSLWIAAAVAFPQTSETLPPIVTLTTSTTTSTTIFPRLSSSVTQVVQPSSSVTQVQASQSTSLSIPFEHSLPCLTQPIGNVVAGSNITYGMINNSNATCQMVMTFNDPDFLPLSLTAIPNDCAGDQLATFQVPASVGSGLASVQWLCAGEAASSCSLFNVQNGSNQSDAFAIARENANISVICQDALQKRAELSVEVSRLFSIAETLVTTV